MKVKRTISFILVSFLFVGMLVLPVEAAQTPDSDQSMTIIPFATDSFSLTVSGKTVAKADTSFSMAKGETISISANYSPFYADVDIGVVSPNGDYIYISSTEGKFDQSLLIEESGRYTLMVRNNSNREISISGVVNY